MAKEFIGCKRKKERKDFFSPKMLQLHQFSTLDKAKERKGVEGADLDM